eukprot:scaffold7194_cov181-Ochromonas_danica.AAC.8
MLLTEPFDHYHKRREVVCEVVSHGFWLLTLSYRVDHNAGGAFHLTLYTACHGLVHLNPSFVIPLKSQGSAADHSSAGHLYPSSLVEGVVETTTTEGMRGEGGSLIWDGSGSQACALINNQLYFFSIAWLNKTSQAVLSMQEAAVLACSLSDDQDQALLTDHLSARITLTTTKAQQGKKLRYFKKMPSFFFVINAEKVHQWDWSTASPLKAIVAGNGQHTDRWIFRPWDSFNNHLTLHDIAILTDGGEVNAENGLSARSNFIEISLDEEGSSDKIGYNSLGFDDQFLTTSIKSQCVKDIYGSHLSALIILFLDGSFALYFDSSLADGSPYLSSTPIHREKRIALSARAHMVCRVAYPIFKGPTMNGGSRPDSTKNSKYDLLREPEIYEMNANRDYASKAVTLNEVQKYLMVNDNIFLNHHYPEKTTSSTTTTSNGQNVDDKECISVSLYHKIARSISIVNGSAKEDIADVIALCDCPNSNTGGLTAAMGSMELLMGLRVKHVLEDPQYQELLEHVDNNGAELHNIRVNVGFSYAIARVVVQTNQPFSDDVRGEESDKKILLECKEMYKVGYSLSSSDHTLQLQFMDRQINSVNADLVALVFGASLSIRCIGKLYSELYRVQLDRAPLYFSIASNAFLFWGSQSEKKIDYATYVSLMPFHVQSDQQFPSLFFNESLGQMVQVDYPAFHCEDVVTEDSSGREFKQVLSGDRKYISMPKLLRQSMIFNKSTGSSSSLGVVIAGNQFNSVSFILSHKLSLTEPMGFDFQLYIDQYLNISEKAESRYFAITKNKLKTTARISTSASLLHLPEVYICNLRTKKWKNILLAIVSNNRPEGQQSVKLIKNVPSVSYHNHTTSILQSTSSNVNQDLSSHSASMWEIDMDGIEQDKSIPGVQPSTISVPKEDFRSRSSSTATLSSLPTPTNHATITKEPDTARGFSALPPLADSPQIRNRPPSLRLASSSAPVSAKSQLILQHVQVLKMNWWGSHSLVLLTLRKSQHYLEFVSRETSPIYQTLPLSSSNSGNIHHNVSKLHRLLPLPVGFIPRFYDVEEVHFISGQIADTNKNNAMVVITGNDTVLIAFIIHTVHGRNSLENTVVDYNVVELWNVSLESVKLDQQGQSLLSALSAEGGLKTIKSYVQQSPIFGKHLSNYYHIALSGNDKDSAFISLPYLSAILVDENDNVYLLDAIQGMANIIPTNSSGYDPSDAMRYSLFGRPKIDLIKLVGPQSLPLQYFSWNTVKSRTITSEEERMKQIASSETVRPNNQAIMIFHQPIDHVRKFVYNSLLTLTRFDLLGKFAKNPIHRELNLYNKINLAETCNNLVIFGSLPLKLDNQISYMPSFDKADGWLEEQLLGSNSSENDTSGVVMIIDLTRAHQHNQLQLQSAGFVMQAYGNKAFLSNINHALFFRLYELNMQQVFQLRNNSVSAGKEAGKSNNLVKRSPFRSFSLLTGKKMKEEQERDILYSLLFHWPRRIVSFLSTSSTFAYKHFIVRLEELFLSFIHHSPTIIASVASCQYNGQDEEDNGFGLFSNYMLLASFVTIISKDLFIVVMARVLRQTEPVVSRNLFPILITNMVEEVVLYNKFGSEKEELRRQKSFTLVEAFETTLSRPLLLCSNHLLSLLCESLGGTESLFTIYICLMVCVEFIFYTLQYNYMDSTLQCVDFTERLLTILYERKITEVEKEIDLVATKKAMIDYIRDIRKLALPDRLRFSGGRDDKKNGSVKSVSAKSEKATSGAEGGIFTNMRWLLSQIGVIPAEDSASKSSSMGAKTPVSSSNGVHLAQVHSFYVGLDRVQKELGIDVFQDLWKGVGMRSPRHNSRPSHEPLESDGKNARVNILDPDPLHRRPSADHSVAMQPRSPLTVTERVALLLGALLADRLRTLLGIHQKQPEHPQAHHFVNVYVMNNHGSGPALHETSSHQHPSISIDPPTNGHLESKAKTSESSLSSPSTVQYGNPLLLILTLMQSPRALDLIHIHLSITLKPVLNRMFSFHGSLHDEHVPFDYERYEKMISEGNLSSSSHLQNCRLLPELADRLPLLNPLWNMLRLHKFIQTAGSGKGSSGRSLLHNEMLHQEVSMQYIYRQALLEQMTYMRHDVSSPRADPNLSNDQGKRVSYFGLFPDDSTAMLYDEPFTIETAIRAIVVIFLFLQDVHIALSILFIVRDLYEPELHSHILKIQKLLEQLHAIRRRLQALGSESDVRLYDNIEEEDLVDGGDHNDLQERLRARLEHIQEECNAAIQDLLFAYILSR